MEASQKDMQEKKREDLSLRNIVRKHIEYGVVALLAVGTVTLVNNYKHQRHEYQNQNAFNTVQNIENKVFIDRLRLSGGLSGVIVATATNGCPYTAILDVPNHIPGLSPLQQNEIGKEIVKVVSECGKAVGSNAKPHFREKASASGTKISLRTN